MYNPYEILGINEDATSQEIRAALKKQINTYCGTNENLKNENGRYYKEILSEACDTLLDKDKRKEIDMILQDNKKNYSLAVVNNEINISYINTALCNNNIKFKKGLFAMFDKVDISDVYILFSCDSVMIAKEDSSMKKSRLYDFFTEQLLTYDFKNDKCPWDKAETFKIFGDIEMFAMLGSRVIPVDIISKNGRVSIANLKILKKFLTQLINNKPEIVEKVFQKEK